MMKINGNTKLFGIIGNPVKHSLSPAMHNSAFQELGENSAYLPFCVADVENAIAGVKALGINGASVTIPHKEAVIPCLDHVDPVAAKIGAVNTLHVIEIDGKKTISGSNTDWIGANKALGAKASIAGKKAIILGAGGSARALGFGLQEEGATVALCSRTEAKGKALADELGCDWYPLSDTEMLQGNILVNATSVGMAPNEDVSLMSIQALQPFEVVMDIVYAPLETQLLKNAKEAGCSAVNGLEMLLYQGVAQFELWTGKTAPVEIMRKVLLKATGNK